MAWDHDRDRIAVVRHSYGAKSLGASDGAGDVRIGSSLPIRDREQCAPAGELKVSPAQIEQEGELTAGAGEVLLKFSGVLGQRCGGLGELHGTGFRAQIAWVRTDRLLSGQTGVKLQGHQASL